jgi:hypothetical protein
LTRAFAERIHFLRRQAANKILTAKELEKRHEDAVVVGTPEVAVLVVADEIAGHAESGIGSIGC